MDRILLEPRVSFKMRRNPVEMSIYTNGMAINSFGTLFLTNSEQNREVTPYVSMAQAHTVHRASGTVSLLEPTTLRKFGGLRGFEKRQHFDDRARSGQRRGQ